MLDSGSNLNPISKKLATIMEAKNFPLKFDIFITGGKTNSEEDTTFRNFILIIFFKYQYILYFKILYQKYFILCWKMIYFIKNIYIRIVFLLLFEYFNKLY